MTVFKNAIRCIAGNPAVTTMSGAKEAEIGPPVEYGGRPDTLNPEELFVASINSCLMLVFHLLRGPEKELALREIFRILKPGGRYVCAEFKTVPVGLLRRRLSVYPSDLIETVGFDVDTQLAGPSITKHRPVVYRALARPHIDCPRSRFLLGYEHPHPGRPGADERESPG